MTAEVKGSLSNYSRGGFRAGIKWVNQGHRGAPLQQWK